MFFSCFFYRLFPSQNLPQKTTYPEKHPNKPSPNLPTTSKKNSPKLAKKNKVVVYCRGVVAKPRKNKNYESLGTKPRQNLRSGAHSGEDVLYAVKCGLLLLCVREGPEFLGGPGGFRKIQQAWRIHVHLFLSEMDFMAPRHDEKQKVHEL